MPGPCVVNTIGISFQRVYECEVECCEHAVTIVTSKELTAIREVVVEEAPDPKQSDGSFEPVEGAKEVLIDPSNDKGLRTINSKVFIDAWNIEQLRRFYP